MMVKFYLRSLLLSGCLAAIVSGTNPATAQTSAPVDVPPVIVPPAPNAATLGAYGDVPVSPYVGQANVTVPLYTIETAQHKLNISLSYQGGGMKVDQEASWVGLGWALNAGGVITRSLRGNDDLNSLQNRQGFLYSSASIPPCITDPMQSNYNDYDVSHFANNVNNDVGYFGSACNSSSSAIDMQPDAFYYNFAGHSGQFCLKRPGNNVPLQAGAPLLIETLDKTDNLDIQGLVYNAASKAGWLITTAEGYRYYFFEVEMTTLKPLVRNEPLQPYASAWYLSRIEAPNGESIVFTYKGGNNNTSQVTTSRTQTMAYVSRMPQASGNGTCTGSPGTTGPIADGISQNTTKTVGVLLEQISFAGGTVSFAAANRSDLLPNGAAVPQRITGLTVRQGSSLNGRVIKQIDFQQGYFNASAPSSNVPQEVQRLRLDKVVESNAGIAKPAHSFTYFETVSSNGLSLPSKLSKAQDYGGYFNGRFGNESLDFLPQVQVDYTDQNGMKQSPQLPGADRQPVVSFAKIGTLRTITYPTGGKTDFDYELHTYQNATTPGTTLTGCGLRISTISSTSAEAGTVAKTQRFSYNQIGSMVSSGRSMSDYVFAYSTSTIPLPYTCGFFFNTGGYLYWNTYVTRTSASNAPLSTAASGQNIGYDVVTMSEESTDGNGQTVYNGKTEHYYTNRTETQPSRYFPGIPNKVPQDNGQLLTQITYKTTGTTATGAPIYQKVTELNNTYLFTEDIAGKGIVCSPILCKDPVAQSSALYGQGVRYYDIKWKWARLSTATTKVYDQSTESKFTTAAISYAYDNPVHRQVTKTVQTASDGALRTTYLRYPADYPNAAGPIAAMANTLHLHTPVVETYSTITHNGTEQVTAGQYTSFSFANPTQTLVRPQQMQTLRLAQPLSLGTGGFAPAQFVPQAGGGYALQLDGHYSPTVSLEYEADLGNVSVARKADDAPVSYQWGYAGQLPIAVFTNASRSQPIVGTPAIGNEASYLGFENNLNATSDPSTDYWAKVGIGRGVTYQNTEAHTGTGAFRVGEAVVGGAIPGPTRTFSPDGQTRRYRFSAWVKTESSAFVPNAGRLSLAVKRGSNGTAVANAGQEIQFGSTNGKWVYLEVVVDLATAWQQLGIAPGAGGERLQVVATSANIGGSTGNASGYFMDDIRFEPVDAQTTTYTYDLVTRQPTSSSDANNRPVYYEYDNLQRLKLVRDHKGQIVKHLSYHYQKQ